MRHGIRVVPAAFALTVLVACGPSEAEQANARGKECLAAKDFACARTAFADAARLKPTDAAYHYNLGLALGHLGQHAAAEASLQEALRLRPDFGAAKEALDIVREQKAKAAK